MLGRPQPIAFFDVSCYSMSMSPKEPLLETHVKKAEGAIAVARLERVASVLAQAAHPGVVEFVTHEPTGLESAELRTVAVDAPTLADRPLPPEELAGVVAAVATTLADLHSRGLVHGAIEPSHILVPLAAPPRLCGFSGDPAGSSADDVAGLGRLLQSSGVDRGGLDTSDNGGIAARRLADLRLARRGTLGRWIGGRTGPAPAHDHAVRRTLEDIARLATATDPDRRPSADALAALLHDRVPGARLPGAAASHGREGVGRSGTEVSARARVFGAELRSLALATLTVVALGVIVLAVGAMLPGPSVDVEGRATVSMSTTAQNTARVWPGGDGCEPVKTALQADVDADGCADAVVYSDGLLISDSRRLAVGDAGDLVATGDWHCDGLATLVLLRRSSGSVWHFPSWPLAGNSVVGTLVARDLDAATIASRVGNSGCSLLDVGLNDGTVLTLDVPEPEGVA